MGDFIIIIMFYGTVAILALMYYRYFADTLSKNEQIREIQMKYKDKIDELKAKLSKIKEEQKRYANKICRFNTLNGKIIIDATQRQLMTYRGNINFDDIADYKIETIQKIVEQGVNSIHATTNFRSNLIMPGGRATTNGIGSFKNETTEANIFKVIVNTTNLQISCVVIECGQNIELARSIINALEIAISDNGVYDSNPVLEYKVTRKELNNVRIERAKELFKFRHGGRR